jgi:hypothetical protein
VEIYKRETREIIQRFMLHHLSFENCIASLDAALSSLILRLHPGQLDEVRAVMLANNEIVMKEMQKRAQKKGG